MRSPTSSPVRNSRRLLLAALRDLRLSTFLLIITVIPSVARGQVATPAAPVPADGATDGAAAHIIHVPGIAGPMSIDRRMAEGLVAGGAGGQYEIFDWVGTRRGFRALFGEAENRRQARRLAEHIIALKRANPGQPLVITAHSGGTAVVAWALEVLPEVRSAAGAGEPAQPLVDGVILIASGLSPSYDLSPMLREVAGRVFHLSSNADNFILGAGTLVFGTLDREFGVAAGKTGFRVPAEAAEAEAYERYVEVPYDRAWAEMGHYGDHEGMMSAEFGRSVMANLVRASLGEKVDLPTTRPAGTSENESTEVAASQAGTRPTTRPASDR